MNLRRRHVLQLAAAAIASSALTCRVWSQGLRPLAERLADYADRLRYDDLDPATVEQVKILVVDTIGCGIAAFDEPPVRICRDIALAPGGGAATVIGTDKRTTPDLASFANGAAFKRALLSARTIGYRDPATGSTSGTYTARLLERLGIAATLKPKTRLDRSNGEHPEQAFGPLANGEIDLQIGQITEIAIAPGVDLAGPLPPEIQDTTLLAAGIVVTSKAQDDARAFIRYLTSPAVAKVLTTNGFLPAAEN